MAEAEAAQEEAMGDLLVCLGQEEAKVEALSTKLKELGVNVEAELARVVSMQEDDDADDYT